MRMRFLASLAGAFALALAVTQAQAPSAVADAVVRAISSTHPKERYVVSPSAVLLLGLRRLLPDTWWDRFLARTYPRPGIGSYRGSA